MRQLPPMLRQCSAVIFTLAITACASVAPTTGPLVSPAIAWQTRQAELGKFQSWTLNGRIAVKDANDSWNTMIYWRQHNNDFDLRFMTHLGQGVAQLNSHSGNVTLQTPDEQVTAGDVNELLRNHLGWTVPVQGLRYWVLGLPAPDFVANKELDKQGRLVWLEQNGWHIEFVRYWKTGEFEIPRKIMLEHPELHVRLIIDRWEPESNRLDQRNSRHDLMINDAYN